MSIPVYHAKSKKNIHFNHVTHYLSKDPTQLALCRASSGTYHHQPSAVTSKFELVSTSLWPSHVLERSPTKFELHPWIEAPSDGDPSYTLYSGGYWMHVYATMRDPGAEVIRGIPRPTLTRGLWYGSGSASLKYPLKDSLICRSKLKRITGI